jgi:hypothetical protein
MLLRGAVPVASLALAGGGAIFLNTSAASAASSTSSTDYIYVNDGTTNVLEPLPAGTPDVVTPLTNALTAACNLVPGYEVAQLTLGEVLVCVSPYVGDETIVAGTPNVGILMSYFGTGCGETLYVFPVDEGTVSVGVAPPGYLDC